MRLKILSFLSLVSLFFTSNGLRILGRDNAGSRTVGDLSTDETFRIIDSNKDGKLSLIELQEAASFAWNDLEASNRARITFDPAHPADFILAYDADGDGQLSKDEFSEPMSEIQLRSSSECGHLTDHLDTCKTHQLIKCTSTCIFPSTAAGE